MPKIDYLNAALFAGKFTLDMADKRVKTIKRQIKGIKTSKISVVVMSGLIPFMTRMILSNPDKASVAVSTGIGLTVATYGITKLNKDKKNLDKQLEEAEQEQSKIKTGYGKLLVRDLIRQK